MEDFHLYFLLHCCDLVFKTLTRNGNDQDGVVEGSAVICPL